MKNPIGITITAQVNLFILAILLLDTFVLSPVTILESFREADASKVGSGTTYSRSRYYLIGQQGQVYKVSENIYLEMNHERSQYLISKSAMFKRPLRINYTYENTPRQENLNVLNNTFGEVIAAFVFVISILNITRKPLLKAYNFNTKAVPICSIFLFWVINFFFSW